MAKFKNDQQKRNNIIAALEQLKNDIGWKVIVKALENDVRAAEARLHGDIKLGEDETIKGWQNTRRDRIQMIELPDTLIEENKEKEGFDPLLDPYD